MLTAMPRKLPPFVYRERTRHGRTVWYFRRGKGLRVRLPEFGSAEFDAAYARALAGETTPDNSRAPAMGSLASLIAQYRLSSAFRAYSPATRRQRDNIFLHIIEKAGNQPARAVTRAHVIDMREKLADRPAQARNWLDALRGLFRWAVETGRLSADPTDRVTNPPRRKGQGFEIWAVEEVERYRAHWPLGTRQRLWLEVLIGCGARRGDAVTLGRQHIRDGLLMFRTEKSGSHVTAYAPIPPAMLEAIEAGPCGDLTFIVGDRGHALTKESFGNCFKAACRQAGIEGKSAHGLRKFAATAWAENGLTESELESIFGWTRGSQMAAHYTREAAREALARNAAARIANRKPPHLSGGAGFEPKNPMKTRGLQ